MWLLHQSSKCQTNKCQRCQLFQILLTQPCQPLWTFVELANCLLLWTIQVSPSVDLIKFCANHVKFCQPFVNFTQSCHSCQLVELFNSQTCQLPFVNFCWLFLNLVNLSGLIQLLLKLSTIVDTVNMLMFVNLFVNYCWSCQPCQLLSTMSIFFKLLLTFCQLLLTLSTVVDLVNLCKCCQHLLTLLTFVKLLSSFINFVNFLLPCWFCQFFYPCQLL